MKKPFGYFLLGLTAAYLLAAIGGCGQSEGNAKESAEDNHVRSVKVSVVQVQPTMIRDVLVLPGETKPWQDVRVSADQGGTVEWIGFREGDSVKKGELLAKIDVSSLKASLDNAQASYNLAEDYYQRRKRLFDRKIISQEELDQSQTEKEVKAGLLRQARVEYEKGFVYSPIDGLINHLYVDPGEFVGYGDPVADLVNVDQIEIDVNVPELDVRYLSVGQDCLVRVDAFMDRQMTGRVDFIAFKADSATKTFRVKVVTANPQHDIRPGMIARVALLRRVIPDAVVAPLFALVDKGGERVLFVEKDGVAHSRTVSLGVIDGDHVQITKGLEIGDHLIVTGQTEVEEGTKVQAQ